MPQYDGSIRINTEITTKQSEKELKQLESSIKKTASEISQLQKEMESIKTPTKQYESLQHAINTSKTKLEALVAEQKRLSDKGIGKGIDKEYLAASEAVNQLKYDLQQTIETGDKDAYLGIEDRLNRAKSILQEMMSKNPRPLGDIAYYYSVDEKINDIKSNISSTESEMKKLEESGKAFTLGEGSEEKAARIKELTAQMGADMQRRTELQFAIAAEEQRLADIKSNSTVSDQQIIDLSERRKQLLKEISDLEKAGVGLGYQEYDSANQELEKINNQIREYKKNLSTVPEKFSNMQKSAKKAFNTVASETKKSSGLFSGFTNRFKGLALSLLIFNQISKAFNAMISGMKQGFTNFMNYSDNFANSVQGIKNAMSTLGNQFAAAFSPIVQMIIPWLTKLVSAISTAITYVSQFIAILGGKSTFTRAKQIQDSYNKSLGGTASAAKKAAGALAKFDDLDVLQKKEDDSGGGAGGTDPSQMFEEVPVDSEFKNWLDGILEKIKPILDYFEKLKDIFMEGFWDGLGDWEYRLESIKSSLASIKESLIDIFTDPAVLASADTWAQSVAYMLGSLVGSMASIGLTMATNLLGGIASYLEDNKDRIKEYLISMFDIGTEINYIIAELSQAIAYIFEAFASPEGIQLTANAFGIILDTLMGISEIALKVAEDVLNIFAQPVIDNAEGLKTALEGILGFLASITGTIKQGIDDTFDKLNEVYDAHFKPFFDSIATGLSEILAKFLEFWNGKVQPIMDQWAAAFDVLWKEHIQPFINSFIDLLGSAADLLKTFWEQGIQPLINWIADNVLPVVLPILEAIYNTIVTVIGDAADLLSGFANTIKSIIDTVVSLINGDWAGAWESAKGIFENAFNSILAFAQMMWDSFIGVINVALQTIIGAVRVTLMGVYDFITGIWTGIYESTYEIWTMLVDWLTENFTSFHDFLSTMLENILLFFTETWENITSVFQTFIDFINETIIPIWQESWDMAGSLFQIFKTLINQLINAIKEFLSGFMKSVKLLVNGDWKGAWNTAKEVFSTFKTKVDEIIKAVRTVLESFFEWVSGMISRALESISKIGDAVKGAFSGGGFSGKTSLTAASISEYNFENVPKLATGSVIRGGNPFMAILGDQPSGQTNIEAPLPTIVDAFKQAISEMGGIKGNEKIPVNISINYDNETFMRVAIPDLLSELSREGFNVDVLGVT